MPTPKDKLAKLVNSFRIADYRLMSEATVRLSYIDSFWEALGWNIRDFNQVMVEQVDDFNKKPDYRFIVNGKTQFFVEAKKPSEKLINPRHIYQTKLYCWNGNVPLAILTDFEEFRPFHSIGQPFLEEAKKGLLTQFDMTFEQYPDRADELLNTFGREAVLAGSLQELLKTPPKMLKDSVDKAFLRSLSDWRKLIADNIAKNNQFKSEYDLSEAVQRILDRIVFLRVLNDRDIEDKDQLELILSKGGNYYENFVEICKSFAPKYNGLIFNPHQVSEELEIDDYVFQPILKDFSYENSPYRFDEIPVEMLGTIYEQFLGDEVTLDNGRAVIEQKPEVRKAGGVYYTPQYIVEYIVDNTVGKLLENCKTPADAAKLKICDPACGSGSFLLGAFDKLIKWHENYFAEHPEKAYDTIGKSKYLLAYQDGKDNNSPVHLTARMKGQILKNNLFGVDLDRQATEVAQMSLYIKCLEGLAKEPTFTLGFMEAILPKLDGNIKCGNSLIGSDFMHEDFFGLSEKERRKINPFDWEEQFPEVFGVRSSEIGVRNSRGDNPETRSPISEPRYGFDAVIGNPPYVSSKELPLNFKKYCNKEYFVAKDQYDLYSLFIEKAINLITKNGLFGFIIPDAIIDRSSAKTLRKFIIDNVEIMSIFQLYDVFEDATVGSVVLLLKKNIPGNNKVKFIKANNFIDYQVNSCETKDIMQLNFENSRNFAFYFMSDAEFRMIDKIFSNKTQLGNISFMGRGEETGKSDKSILKHFVLEGRKIILGEDIGRYGINFNNNYILNENIKKSGSIYEEKIVVRQVGKNINAAFDDVGYVTLQSTYSIVPRISAKFVLGVINSRIIDYIFQKLFKSKEIFPRILLENLKEFPIPQSPKPEIHKKLVELVERMLKLNKDKQTADEFTKKQLEQFIARTDKEIDALVYELYGLTEEEIKIVEGK